MSSESFDRCFFIDSGVSYQGAEAIPEKSVRKPGNELPVASSQLFFWVFGQVPKMSFVVNTSFRHTHVLFYNIKHLSKTLSGTLSIITAHTGA